jgi:Ran GTPase-activating protein (RanGAP) involved in mRNA processing and transport
MEEHSLDARLRELEVFTFARPPEPEEDATGRLAYRATCEKLDRQEGGFYRFPIDSVVAKLDKPDINLSHCGIGDKGAQALAETLKINSSIVTLDLTDNHLTPVGGEYLIKALVGNKTVRVLNLAENRLGHPALAGGSENTIGANVRQLLAKNSTITDLSLRSNKIGDRDMERIAEGVIDNVTITRLDVSYNDLGPRGAAAIADLLAHGSADLRELRIEWNQLQRIGALAVLKDGLLHNGTVRHFCMSWNGMGDEGGEVLGEIIKGSMVLEVVDVSHNRIGPKGAEAIAKGIQENGTLVRLVLSNNPLQDQGCAAIIRALRDNKSIAMIDLRDTGAAKAARAELADTLKTKPAAFSIEVPESIQPDAAEDVTGQLRNRIGKADGNAGYADHDM